MASGQASLGADSSQGENIYCPECGNPIASKMLAVHRNRMHNVPLPKAPPRSPTQPDVSVPNWISDQAPPPKPVPAAPVPEALDEPEPEDQGEAEGEIPEHEHVDYKGSLESHDSEITTLKHAIANLDRNLKEREAQIAALQGMLSEVVKKGEENEMATATPIIYYDTDLKRVVGMNLLYRKKGQPVEGLLKKLIDGWHKENHGVEFSGLPPNMSLRLKDDAAERGFDMVPSTVLVLRLSKREREGLGPMMEAPAGSADAPPNP